MGEEKNSQPFVHLHVHSAYSLGEGLSTPSEICAYAHRSGYRSIALTDTGNTYGFMEFHKEANQRGLKPLYGAVIYHKPVDPRSSGRSALGVIALSREGLANLTSLVSLFSSREGPSPALEVEELMRHSDGLIALSGSSESELGNLIISGEYERAVHVLSSLRDLFGERLFVEVQDHALAKEKNFGEKLFDIASALRIRPVLTQDVRYIGQEKQELFGLLCSLRNPFQEGDFFIKGAVALDRSLRSQKEMHELRAAYREAYDNASYIDSLVDGDLLSEVLGESHFSDSKWMAGKYEDPFHELVEKAWRRFDLFFYQLPPEENQRLRSILGAETEQIHSEGLERTFIIFHEILSALRQGGIQTGPATGLSIQSLYAYLLGITNFNPYAYDQSFKPIFKQLSQQSSILEVQLASEDKEAFVNLLRRLFDGKNMAYIPSLERITPGRALKMVARTLDVGDEKLGEVVKIALQQTGLSLKDLCEENRELGRIYRHSARVRELIKHAALLEGLPIGFIRSKRSIVLSPRPLGDFLGRMVDKDTGETFVQGTRDAFPAGNLYRIDLTALSALSVCLRAERELRKRKIKTCGWDNLPLEDEKVWANIQKGEAVGIYLLDSSRVQKQCSAFSPQSIDDLTNFLSLLRLPRDARSFADRLSDYKSGVAPEYEYKPKLMNLLGRMHGMILYEEQLRDIISLLTGLDEGRACEMMQLFRSEDPGELSALRREFMMHSANEDIPMEESRKWFEKILYYSFRTVNRQRILSDALLVFKMFYLKRYHTSHFFLSLLNTYWDNEAKIRSYLAYLHDLRMLLPVDINRSELYFTLEDGKIRLGLSILKDVGYPSLLQVLKARGKRRRFKSLEDFIRRTKGKGVAMEEVGSLILSGAFDFSGISRTNMINALPELFENPAMGSTKELRHQLELPFSYPPWIHGSSGKGGDDLLEILLSNKSPEGGAKKPRKDYRVISALEDFYSQRSTALVEIAGEISNLQRLKTNSGKVLGFFVLFDFSAFVHVFIPWDRFGLYGRELEEGKKVIVRGRVSVRDDKKVCEAEEISAFSEGAGGNGERDPDESSERNP